jgi:diguanylate cyclase (GGDEF)-like protein
MDEFENGNNQITDRSSQHTQQVPPHFLANPTRNIETGKSYASSDDKSHNLYALIIDDDKNLTYTFANALLRVGYRCEVANSAKEALYKLAFSEPNLVLLDLYIGHEIDGEDILFLIRTNPRLDITSVIVISAYPEGTALVAELADLVMVKPVEVKQLQELSRRFGYYRSEPDMMHISDPLTGLYNRNFFFTRLEHAIERARRRPNFHFATLALSIDLVERTNGDTEYDVSKPLLREVAKRLQPSLRPTDTIAFLFEKTFATLLEDLKRPQDTQVVIDRIERTLAHPYEIQGKTIPLAFSLGAVIHDQGYKCAAELFNTTEETMKLARQTGNNRHLIVPTYGSAPMEFIAPSN